MDRALKAIRYTRERLYAIRRLPGSKKPTPATLKALSSAQLLHYRGCRGGRRIQRNIAAVIGNRNRAENSCINTKHNSSVLSGAARTGPAQGKVMHSNLIKVPLQRNDFKKDTICVFGSLNIRSLSCTKAEALLLELKERHIHVLALCETWHDPDSVSIRRFRNEGFSVVERARPRTDTASTAVNHGGVAVVASPGIHLTKTDLGFQPSTFEFISASIPHYLIVVIYRPGSSPITSLFFTELTELLERVSIAADNLIITGDINIRLERVSDSSTIELMDIFSCYGIKQYVQDVTHDAGGTLDVVCMRHDNVEVSIDIIDTGLSDHRMLLWQMETTPYSRTTYRTVTRRRWSEFDFRRFADELVSSSLCDCQQWLNGDVNDLAICYNAVLTELLDRQVPLKSVTVRDRSSSTWFDNECRTAKRALRRTERNMRNARKASTSNVGIQLENKYKDQCQAYHNLINSKCSQYWLNEVHMHQDHPGKLWHTLNDVMGRARKNSVNVNNVTASDLHEFFDKKIEAVRESTKNAPKPHFTSCPSSSQLSKFNMITCEQILKSVAALPNKQCSLDPLPTWLLKQCIEYLAPFLSYLFNLSLQTGTVPTFFKSAYITPILKKSDLDSSDVKSYRPISNLSVLSKLLERLVSQQFLSYLNSNHLIPDCQSAYRAYHSTETAIIKVCSDILQALDSGKAALVTLLDLSAAFDSVDHDTLIKRLEISFGINGTVLDWFKSYLSLRVQYVTFSDTVSTPSTVQYGVPQGSVLGPILFITYTADVLKLVHDCGLSSHCYADDNDVYGSCKMDEYKELSNKVSSCIDSISLWMKANRLQLNPSKTELMWCSSTRLASKAPSEPVRIDDTLVPPVKCVGNLGIHLDENLTNEEARCKDGLSWFFGTASSQKHKKFFT
jgi:exonuclease III